MVLEDDLVEAKALLAEEADIGDAWREDGP
jgi:hypothetical protein